MVVAVATAIFGSAGGISLFGVALTTAAGGLTIAGTLVNAALLSAASRAARNTPSAPRPEDIKRIFRQAVGPRYVHVGQNLVGGQAVFRRAKEGFYHQITTHGHNGPYEIIEVRLDNVAVDISATHMVTNEKYHIGGRRRVRIDQRRGNVPSPSYSHLTGYYPDWTDAHRLDGQCTTYLKREQVPPEDHHSVYPNDPPAIMVLTQSRPVYDPRIDALAYSENAALHIADFLSSIPGIEGRINTAMLIEAANGSDVAVPLLAGGTEPRWRLNMSYSLAEDKASVLARMLDSCAGSISFLPDGTIGIRVGKSETASVTIGSENIEEVVEVTNGPDLVDIYSELPFTYVDRGLNYIEVTGDPWVRADVEDDLGATVTAATLNLNACCTHTQARRAARIKSYQDNPEITVTLRLKPNAMDAVFESVVDLDFGIMSGKYRVKNWSLDPTSLMSSVELEKVDDEAFVWSTSEEGLIQTRPAGDDGGVVPSMANFNAAGVGVQTSQTTFAAGITVAWEAATSDALTPIIEYLPQGMDEWVQVILTGGQTSAQIGGLIDGSAYDVRGYFSTISGDKGEYTTESGVVALAASAAPAVPTALTVTDQGGGSALVEVVSSAAKSNWKTFVYRDGVEVFSQASEASQALAFTDTPGAGTYDYTAKSINVSNVPSALTAVVAATIT